MRHRAAVVVRLAVATILVLFANVGLIAPALAWDTIGGASSEAGQVNAVAAATTYTLTVSKAGDGAGTVHGLGTSPLDPFIICGPHCTADASPGTTMRFIAVPDPGSSFAGWGGACSGTALGCTVVMDGPKTVTATFVRSMVSLTIVVDGPGVVNGPVPMRCTTLCSHALSRTQVVPLTATPAAGASFVGWGGACTGTGTCEVTMDGDKHVTATFRAAMAGVTVGRGTGADAPDGIPTLTASLSARSICGPLQEVQVGVTGRPFANATVSITAPIGGPTDQTSGFLYTPPAGTTTVNLTVRRIVQSGGATISPIRLRDGCGDWTTFVGGGADAFR